MLNNKAIERFKALTLDEKREVISLYFDAYKRATAKNIPVAFRDLKVANSLWGNSELNIIFHELLGDYSLADYQVIKFENQIEEVLDHLIDMISPSKDL